ncbi:heavy-metal-associated domain-containing protein [Deminuibacter soli]|uniref:Copper chaperone n=1 Tax=Deminuibacter soli TaxID=2291815 RepID=A0A3E1NJM5_9BACT|nr:copper chaperone [Deminuibacter soli]RFM28129.1 copper chaperone [Deminuibacter soli]
MKKLLFLVVLMLACRLADAQEKKAEWATIKIPQLKCWECKNRLESYLSREKGPNDDAGIMRWVISMPAATLRIQYIPTRITLDYIKTAINNAGFDADTARATEDAYKALPPVCKRPEEGGGPQKGKPCNMPPM